MKVRVNKILLLICIASLSLLQSDTVPEPRPHGENGSEAPILIVNVRSNSGLALEAEVNVVKAPNTFQQVAYNGVVTIACIEPGLHQTSVSIPGYQPWQQSIQVIDTTTITAILIPIH